MKTQLKKFTVAASIAAIAIAAAVSLVPFDRAEATALTDSRNTPEVAGGYVTFSVTSGQVIYAGSMVALDTASGEVLPASDTTNRVVVGRAEQTIDSRLIGDLTILVRRGIFRYENGDSFADTDIGSFAYVEDDQTVQTAASATADLIAGVIYDVDSSGVWVDMRGIPTQGAESVTSLTVSGNGSVGGTFSVTGASTLTGGATAPSYTVTGVTTGYLDIIETATGTNSLVFIVGDTTNIVFENVQ